MIFAVARHPMVERYGFLIRFMVLFTVWGSIAYTFRLYINLSWPGLIQSGLFAVVSTMVFVGFWTRSAMFALGLIVLLQSYLVHRHWAVGVAVLPLVSALLPLGGLYSLDRYLQLGTKPAAYIPSTIKSKIGIGARITALALAAFIVGGPAYNEVFHHHSKFFGSWDMYYKSGTDAIILEFFRPVNGARQHVDYISALGHKREGVGIEGNPRLVKDMRIIGVDQLDGLVERVCGNVDDPASLRLDAKIGTLKRGWRPVYKGDEVICSVKGSSNV